MHPEVITSKAKKLLLKCNNFSNFYLAGGTGLALQIGHRKSIDFDFFTSKKLPSNFLDNIERVFKGHNIDILINQLGELLVKINGIKFSFIHYPFPVLNDFDYYHDIAIASVLENALMRAYTLGRRATLKDYIDLYYIIRIEKVSLKRIMSLCKEKYKDKFSKKLFLEQLIYLEDIQEESIEFLNKQVSKKEIELFFKEKISNLDLNI